MTIDSDDPRHRIAAKSKRLWAAREQLSEAKAIELQRRMDACLAIMGTIESFVTRYVEVLEYLRAKRKRRTWSWGQVLFFIGLAGYGSLKDSYQSAAWISLTVGLGAGSLVLQQWIDDYRRDTEFKQLELKKDEIKQRWLTNAPQHWLFDELFEIKTNEAKRYTAPVKEDDQWEKKMNDAQADIHNLQINLEWRLIEHLNGEHDIFWPEKLDEVDVTTGQRRGF